MKQAHFRECRQILTTLTSLRPVAGCSSPRERVSNTSAAAPSSHATSSTPPSSSSNMHPCLSTLPAAFQGQGHNLILLCRFSSVSSLKEPWSRLAIFIGTGCGQTGFIGGTLPVNLGYTSAGLDNRQPLFEFESWTLFPLLCLGLDVFAIF
eukprot:g10835.t1